MGDGHVAEIRGQGVGQGDAGQQGRDADDAGIQDQAYPLYGAAEGRGDAEAYVVDGDLPEEFAADRRRFVSDAEHGYQFAAEGRHDDHEQEGNDCVQGDAVPAERLSLG